MKKVRILCGSFDPVTAEEFRTIRAFAKKENCRVLLCVKEEGILPHSIRVKLLKKACAPFRSLFVMNGIAEGEFMDITDEAGEAEVRGGMFRKAAYGTRRELAEQGYYLEQIVDACCKPSRAAHSRAVAEVCRYLAHVHGLDEEKAWRIGMLHDVTKRWSDEEARPVVETYYPEMLSYSPKVWHSYTAPVFIRQQMGIHDHEILHAVECHTIGNGTRPMDHIVYIADKCEPTRGYDTSVQMKLSCQSLAAGAAYVLNESKKYILEKEGIHV